MQRRIVLLSIVLLLSLGCSLFFPESQSQEQPAQVPIQVPTTIPTGAATLPPLPDFPSKMELSFFGGGRGPLCDQFNLSMLPPVIGETTYQGLRDSKSPDDPIGEDFPRSALLCLTGIPKDEPIYIKFISPDQKVTLGATIQIADDPTSSGLFMVKWAGYPDAWGEDEAWREGNAINSLAGRNGENNNDINNPIVAELHLWWPGNLVSGVWKVEVSWVGKTISGTFDAKERSLPEVSFGDPSYQTKLFPDINFNEPYTCRLGPSEQPFFAVLNTFPPNTPVYVMVYRDDYDKGLNLMYRAVTYSDNLGGGQINLSSEFDSGKTYFLFGTANPAAKLTGDYGAINFSEIANAMDCVVVP